MPLTLAVSEPSRLLAFAYVLSECKINAPSGFVKTKLRFILSSQKGLYFVKPFTVQHFRHSAL